ncbi:MAG: hypothetical protein COX52_10620, partial [Syntrophobacterales bacterium CG23_combo_of_CG06-09_8_20_14_all_48_27]
MKKYRQSCENYEKAIRYGSRSVYLNLGYVYGLMGDVDKEIEYYRRAVRYDRKDDAAYLNLGAA